MDEFFGDGETRVMWHMNLLKDLVESLPALLSIETANRCKFCMGCAAGATGAVNTRYVIFVV